MSSTSNMSPSPSPIDLRSDTLTQPSEGMRRAMSQAIVGDDVFGEDPTIRSLEEHAANAVGMEAGLFVPSGTMANQIAMLTHCRRGDEVIVGWGAHSYLYESGGGGALAGVQFQILGNDGYFNAEQLEQGFHGMDPSGHCAPTTLVMIENTHNRGGGKWIVPEDLGELSALTRQRGAALHIDGARLWNASVAAGRPPSDWGIHADTVTFCLSKGLGAPVGSVLCGSREWIARAHRYRKMLGGGMRQAGIIAAAGLYALNHHVEDLTHDHRRAQELGQALEACPHIEIDRSSIHTNIVLFTPTRVSPAEACADLNEHVRILPFGNHQIRAVLHRDIDDEGIARAIKVLQDYFS